MASAALSVGLWEYHDEDAQFSYLISGTTSATDPATIVGYACSLDTATVGTVKLAADGDRIFGRIEAFEFRAQEGEAIVTVAKAFVGNLPLKTGDTPGIGVQLLGAGIGEVKANVTATTQVPGSAIPHEVLTYDPTAHTVTVSFGV